MSRHRSVESSKAQRGFDVVLHGSQNSGFKTGFVIAKGGVVALSAWPSNTTFIFVHRGRRYRRTIAHLPTREPSIDTIGRMASRFANKVTRGAK